MGSFNIDVVTTGDVEEQRHNPNWFVDHNHMLRPNQEDEANKLGYFILKVPEGMRQPPQAFSPRGWRFGLHNRETLDSSGSEAAKLATAVQCGLVGEKWVHFRDAIVDDPRAMLACYSLPNGVTSWTNEQIKHLLALDALFLVVLFNMLFPENERRLWTLPSWFTANNVFHPRYRNWVETLRSDLYRVENQIPFVLIDKVVEYVSNSINASQASQGNEPLIGDLQYQQRFLEYALNVVASCFMDTSGEAFEIDNSNSSPFGEKTHILGAIYETICGPKGLLMKQSIQTRVYIHVPPATKLEQSGIKIVGVDGPLCTMSYNKKCLCLPKMRIYDDTVSFIRNMASYEFNTFIDGCLFSDYIIFMCDLIKTSEDLDLL